MPATASPLRYPGGKTQLYSYVKDLLEYNAMKDYTYVEPFAGGAGLALKLLFTGVVPHIMINDLDPAIYAMWYSCLNYPKEMISRVNSVPLTIDEWDRQKEIHRDQRDRSILDLGFSTLFLNRTNISGIICGGVLGGREQTGSSKMDARFNRNTLAKKIVKIHAYKSYISLTNLDAGQLISLQNGQEKRFYNIDPPYVEKGAQLYRNSFSEEDHRSLAAVISRCSDPWIVTYDICDLVKDLYKDYKHSKLDIRYSANIKRSANEYIFFSNNINIPDTIKLC